MTVDIDPSGRRLTVPGSDGAPLSNSAPGRDPTLVRLTSPGGAEATFYPAVGFNLIDWRVPRGDTQLQLMHHEPDVLAGGSGTRSGSPILFPFPNRIARATYSWAGRTYHLGLSSPDAVHAIHGFCAKNPWTDYEAVGDCAVRARFRLSRDAPEQAATWPGDLVLEITFTLADEYLEIGTRVENVADHPVPCGIGFHPYFAPLGAQRCDELRLQCDAASYWVLDNMIPTGELRPVTGNNDLRADPGVGSRQLDDVLTALPRFEPDQDGFMSRARITGPAGAMVLQCDDNYRDVVVFTPENRQSLAVEPYTCPTDAIHLSESHSDVGWRVLEPGERWHTRVRYRVTDAH